MSEPIKLSNLLADLDSVGNNGMTKNAAANNGAAHGVVSTAKNELLAALQSVGDPTVKTAESNSPSAIEGLQKIASDLATSEAAAMEKEANFYGAAVADGFMSRLTQYEQTAPQVKTASVEDEFEKFASENPALVQQAIELGYRDGMDQIKTAEATRSQLVNSDAHQMITKIASTPGGEEAMPYIEQGYSDAMQKLAAVEQGYEDTMEKMAMMQEGYGDTVTKLAAVEQGYGDTMTKLAAIEQGYEDTMGQFEKVASDVYGAGFNNTLNILRSL